MTKKVIASNPLNPFEMLQKLVNTVMGRLLPIVMGKSACTDGKRIILPPTIKTGTDKELVKTFFLSMHELAHNMNGDSIRGAARHRYQNLMHKFYNAFLDICTERAFERKYPGMREYSKMFYTDIFQEPDKILYYVSATKANGVVPYLMALTRYMIGHYRGTELGVPNAPTNPELVADYDTYIADLEPLIASMRDWRDASKLAEVFMNRVEQLIKDDLTKQAQQQKQQQQRQQQQEQEDSGDQEGSEGSSSDQDDSDEQSEGSDSGDNDSATSDTNEEGNNSDANGDDTDDASVSDDKESGDSEGSDGADPDESDDSSEDGSDTEGSSSNGHADSDPSDTDEGDEGSAGSDSDTDEDSKSSKSEEDERDDSTEPDESESEGSDDDADADEPKSDPDDAASDDEPSDDADDKADDADEDEADDSDRVDGDDEEANKASDPDDEEDLPELTDEEQAKVDEQADEKMKELNEQDDPMNEIEEIKKGIEQEFIDSGEYVKHPNVTDIIRDADLNPEHLGVAYKESGLKLLGPEAPQVVNLFVNNTKPHTIRYQRRGRMDFRRINDPRDGLDVKVRKTPGILEQSAVMIGQDYSGSMNDRGKDIIASQLVSGLLYTLDRGAVPCAAFGYTDIVPSVAPSNEVERTYPIYIEVLKRFEEQYSGTVMRRCHTSHIANCTPDLDAMREYAIPELLKRKEKNKVLLWVCDGIPETYNAMLTDRMRYTYKKYIKAVKESGIKVFAFGIQADLSAFFDNDWMYVDTQTLGTALVSKLREYLFRKDV